MLGICVMAIEMCYDVKVGIVCLKSLLKVTERLPRWGGSFSFPCVTIFNAGTIFAEIDEFKNI